MLRRIDGACDSLLFVSSPRCENTTARQTAAHSPRGHTPLRRQHGEELEPPHRAFLRGSGSRINYSRSGLRTAAKAARSCPLWLLSNVRFTPESGYGIGTTGMSALCHLLPYAAHKSHFYSITSSASNCSALGTSRPSNLAACALMTNSNLVDCTTGRSAGFAPFRIRPV